MRILERVFHLTRNLKSGASNQVKAEEFGICDFEVGDLLFDLDQQSAF